MPQFESTSSAARKLGIPSSTLLGLERRGVVGPFQRDAAGRRLISDEDLDAVRTYIEQRDSARRKQVINGRAAA